jgi:hypothetical protein
MTSYNVYSPVDVGPDHYDDYGGGYDGEYNGNGGINDDPDAGGGGGGERKGFGIIENKLSPQEIRVARQRANVNSFGANPNNYYGKLSYLAEQSDKINFNNINGEFRYSISRANSKIQVYTMKITNIDDVLFFATLLTDPGRLSIADIPDRFTQIYNLLINAQTMYDVNFMNIFYNRFKPYMLEGKSFYNKVWTKNYEGRYYPPLYVEEKAYLLERDNPLHAVNRTFNSIYLTPGTRLYNNIFRDIKLREVKYPNLQNFKTEEYDVKTYCVPSYLQKKLKKVYNKISQQLEINPTPTYVELTIILNSIDYNLNVYIIDGEQLQEQTEYKNKINILIHNNHMYVLKNIVKNVLINDIHKNQNKKNIIECKTLTEYANIKSEIQYEGYKFNNGIKYTKPGRLFKEIDNIFGVLSTYTQHGINFYYQSQIRAIRFIDNSIENKQTFDINKCYYNILKNCLEDKDNKYVLPKAGGFEHTRKYTGRIEKQGFYYCSFNQPTEITNALFGSKGWVYGSVIKILNLDVNILYEHVPTYTADTDTTQIEKFKKIPYIDIIHFTGYCANHTKTNTTKYEIDDKEEKDALLNKYNNKIATETKKGISITKAYYKRTSGMYAYMAIVQYARLMLYQLYMTLQQQDPEINVHKIYTDSLTLNKKINISVDELNELLKEYNFSVKEQASGYKWVDTSKEPIPEPIISKVAKRATYKKEYNNIMTPIKKNKSFFLTGKAGYGKTYLMNKKIKPYLDEHKMKYIHCTPTRNLSEEQNINTLHYYTKQSINDINDMFKDVKYFIIDECTLIQEFQIIILQHIKSLGVNFIFMGDRNQCEINFNIMDDFNIIDIADNSIFTVQWHKKARYTKEYDELLNNVLECKDYFKRMNIISSYFTIYNKNEYEDNNNIKITYTNAQRKLLTNAKTTHKIQGFTINEHYSIYEIGNMPAKVLYTALSRCTHPNLITLFQ